MGFQQGLSGLNAASRNLDVIGNNIANANTVGMKTSRAEFAELYAASVGGSSGTGLGVTLEKVTQQFTQGNISVTGNNLDVAINGGGFFQLQQPDNSIAYTRAGNFKLDRVGNLVTNGGAKVMGAMISSTGVRTPGVPLSFPTGESINAKQTTKVAITMNLDARATGSPLVPAVTGANPVLEVPAVAPAPRSTYGTSINVFDTQGVSLPANLYFQKSNSNTWAIYNKLDDPLAKPPVIGRFQGKMEMDGTGNIQSITQPITQPATAINVDGNPAKGVKTTRNLDGTFKRENVDLTYTAVTDASTPPKTIGWTFKGEEAPVAVLPAPLTFDFNLALQVDPKSTNPNNPPQPFSVNFDLSRVTQFGSKFGVVDFQQDGYSDGKLTSVNIANDGQVMASYSNGVMRAEAEIGLVSFRNPQGLAPGGGNLWIATSDAGTPTPGSPGIGNLGMLRAGALEDSNVDLTSELVNMMIAQRSYQANAQTIKTQDQALSTLLNMR